MIGIKNLNDEISLVDLGIYLKKSKTLVISDIHIGIEETLNSKGILIPRMHFKDQLKKIAEILKKIDCIKVIINGDLKHEFGKISETEWRNTLKFIDALGNREILLIKGNHDKSILPILKKRKVIRVEELILENILITHGDVINKHSDDSNIKLIIIGHEHPAILIKDLIRNELFKCYVIGEYTGKKMDKENKKDIKPKQIIVQPSFNLLNIGTDITNEKMLSPYLSNLNDFNVYVVDDDIYDFGKVRKL